MPAGRSRSLAAVPQTALSQSIVVRRTDSAGCRSDILLTLSTFFDSAPSSGDV